jgi:hypothetical protein
MPLCLEEAGGLDMVEKLVPALQLTEEDLAIRAVRLLIREDITAKYVPLSKLSGQTLPDWIEQDEGGWILMVPEDRFDEAIISLEPLMGYSPD